MALALIRLRVAIQRRSRGRDGLGQRWSYALSWLVALAAGLAIGSAVASLETSRAPLAEFAVICVFTVIFVVWVVTPVLVPTLADRTVDPEVLAPYSLSRVEQITGLLGGALLGPTALFTFLVAAGGALVDEAAADRFLVVIGALAYVVLCVAASRSTQAVLSSAVRSRRGRDITTLLGGLVLVGLVLVLQQARAAATSLSTLGDGGAGAVMAWLPPGAAATGTLAARDGDLAGLAVRAAVVLAGVVVSLLLWGWALAQQVEGRSVSSGARRGAARASAGLSLIWPPLRALSAGSTTAAASQQLRYFFFRSPRALQAVLITPAVGVFFAHTSLMPTGVVAAVAGFVWFASINVSSALLGYDQRGVEYLVLSGSPLERVLRGKALAIAAVLTVLGLLYGAGEAVLSGQPRHLVDVLVLAPTITLACSGIGAVASVLNPTDQARTGGRQKGAIYRLLLTMLVQLVASVAFGLGWWALSAAVPTVAAAVLTLGAATTFFHVLVRGAGRILVRDQLEVRDAIVDGTR
ncbi:hypothetical protein [Terrabacter sp. NPDC000476]|uniref:hypothetical protein n=1 Tax=Terrabacter sp. NPDC000476 TaxID=3154258 RepID=UPI0033282A36